MKQAGKHAGDHRSIAEGGEPHGENLQKDQPEEDHQDSASKREPAAEPGEDLIEPGDMSDAGRHCPQKPVGKNAAQVESNMMADPFGPQVRSRGGPSRLGLKVDGVGHDQGPAHPQAVEAAEEAD